MCFFSYKFDTFFEKFFFFFLCVCVFLNSSTDKLTYHSTPRDIRVIERSMEPIVFEITFKKLAALTKAQEHMWNLMKNDSLKNFYRHDKILYDKIMNDEYDL